MNPSNESSWAKNTAEQHEVKEKEEKMEVHRREGASKRNREEACDVGTFCWPVTKHHKRDSCVFFCIDSEEDGRRIGSLVCLAILSVLH